MGTRWRKQERLTGVGDASDALAASGGGSCAARVEPAIGASAGPQRASPAGESEDFKWDGGRVFRGWVRFELAVGTACLFSANAETADGGLCGVRLDCGTRRDSRALRNSIPTTNRNHSLSCGEPHEQ